MAMGTITATTLITTIYYDDGYSGDGGDPSYVVSRGVDPSYCAPRYQSYGPASGTYLGYDGLRHPCQ
jgi:hypothetical protein